MRNSSECSPLPSALSVANARPRVVFLTDIPTPYIIESMRELSLKVDLLCVFCAATAMRGMNWDFEGKLGFRHLVVGGVRIKRQDSTDYYISPRIFWRLVRARPDVIISGGYSIPSLYAYLYCKLTGAKLIIYSDGTSAYEKKLSWLQHAARKVLVPRVSGFIAKSRPAADRFEELGAKKRSIFLAPHTTNMAPLLAVGANRKWSESEELRLLAVGRLIPRKGLGHLVRALSVMRPVRRPVSLAIIGSGPEEPELRALVRSLGVPGVRFVGFVDQDGLPAHYAAADVFVFPTLDDPFGMVLLEAAASGLALVASEHAGATLDFIKDGESGLVFDPHNEQALAELIAKLADSPNLVRDLGLAAYNIARLRTPDRTAQKYLAAIMTVAGDRKL